MNAIFSTPDLPQPVNPTARSSQDMRPGGRLSRSWPRHAFVVARAHARYVNVLSGPRILAYNPESQRRRLCVGKMDKEGWSTHCDL